MGLLARWFTSPRKRRRRKRAERSAVAARIVAMATEQTVDVAWDALRQAFDLDPESNELFRVAASLLRREREVRLAELFDRAADAPHDPRALLELGSALLTEDEARIGAHVLTRALNMVPFDAVVRSELSLAHARSGRPDLVLETLALHPCLADDPGALFEFGWASTLAGDLGAATGVLSELGASHPLREQLRQAIERARCNEDSDVLDARDFYFIEYGGLVLDAGGAFAARYTSLACDDAWWSRILANLRYALEATALRQVVILDERHERFAEAIAEACGLEAVARGKGRLPEGLIPLIDLDALHSLDATDQRGDRAVSLFLAHVDPRASLPYAPRFIGAFACTAIGKTPERLVASELDVDLREFVDRRRELLATSRPRSHGAFVPDAPLPQL